MASAKEEVTAEQRKMALAPVFDRLIETTLSLTQSVERLVRLSWAIIGLNLILIAALVAVVAWAVLR